MKLVFNWKDSWKWFSVHCMSLAAALQGTWMFIPTDLKGNVPDEVAATITVGLLVFGLIGRIVDQE